MHTFESSLPFASLSSKFEINSSTTLAILALDYVPLFCYTILLPLRSFLLSYVSRTTHLYKTNTHIPFETIASLAEGLGCIASWVLVLDLGQVWWVT